LADNTVTVTLQGHRECASAFASLREYVRGNLFSQSLRAAARVLLEEIIARAPQGSPPDPHIGRLISNLRVAVSKRGETIHGRVIINTFGKASDKLNAFYWRFVEYGHRIGTRKSGRLTRSRGAPHAKGATSYVQPRPFVAPAFEAMREQAAQQVIESFEAGLDAAEARARRAGAL